MSAGGDLGNPLRKFKLVFLGEQSGESVHDEALGCRSHPRCPTCVHVDGLAENIFPPSAKFRDGEMRRVCVRLAGLWLDVTPMFGTICDRRKLD